MGAFTYFSSVTDIIYRGIYYANYYGRGGDGRWGKTMKNEELGEKMKKGKEKGRKIT